MSPEPEATLTPAERRARDAVRALPRPEADAAFRARLQREFVSGGIASPAREGAGARRPVRAETGRGPSRPWTGWAAPLTWAAAAVIVVASVIGLNRGARWQVSGVRGTGIAIVDRRPIPLEHLDQLSLALHAGAGVEVPVGADVELALPGELMMEATSGTKLVLPGAPGHWFGRRTAGRIMSEGELRITTGPSFHGARLELETPEARIQVTGTTLAVICEPQGTCVCVLEGKVQVGPRTGAMAEVTGGRRRYLFKDGRAPEMADMRRPERGPLGELREQLERSPAGR